MSDGARLALTTAPGPKLTDGTARDEDSFRPYILSGIFFLEGVA